MMEQTPQGWRRRSVLAGLVLGVPAVDFAASRHALALPSEVLDQIRKEHSSMKVSYGRKRVGDVEVFYREAGRPAAMRSTSSTMARRQACGWP
jgi:hypothetical protein